MSRHLHKEIEKIKKLFLSLGTIVEDRLRQVTGAITDMDTDIADRIIRSDTEIDEMEVEVEEECLKVIALYQPVAVDLRYLIATIKINNELERIADQAVNIAERINVMAKSEPKDTVYDYSEMVNTVVNMLKMSLDAFVNMDSEMAYRVRKMDDEVDAANRTVYDLIKKSIAETPEKVGFFINVLLVARHLERVGDHATNIAEEAIYMIDGEIVRHVYNGLA